MLGSDFLKALHEVMPTQAELEEYGLDSEEIEGIQATFQAEARTASPTASETGSELERLITTYDCSTVEVGLIRFLPEPCRHRDGVQVAGCEADPLVVSESGTILMCYHDDPNRALECAASSESFLDALNVYIAMRRDRARWKGKGEEAADLCAAKAGGRDSRLFFRLICSFSA